LRQTPLGDPARGFLGRIDRGGWRAPASPRPVRVCGFLRRDEPSFAGVLDRPRCRRRPLGAGSGGHGARAVHIGWCAPRSNALQNEGGVLETLPMRVSTHFRAARRPHASQRGTNRNFQCVHAPSPCADDGTLSTARKLDRCRSWLADLLSSP
jgi:hypothetical protein